MTHSELKNKDGVWRPSWVWLFVDLIMQRNGKLGFSYQKTSKMTYCTTFCDNYLNSLVLQDGIWRPSWMCLFRDLKMQNYMKNRIPHTRKPLKRHIVQHSVTIIIQKISFLRWRPSWIYANFTSCPKWPFW